MNSIDIDMPEVKMYGYILELKERRILLTSIDTYLR